jgi:hypothetical protein
MAERSKTLATEPAWIRQRKSGKGSIERDEARD